MTTAPSSFNSPAYDSAWFSTRGPDGTRLVLTTGKEAVLRGQRGLLRWLQGLPANRRDLHTASWTSGGSRITWPGSGLAPQPGDKVFHADAALGPVTLSVLGLYAAAMGHSSEADDVAAILQTPTTPPSSRAWYGTLLELLRAGWGTDAIDLPMPVIPPPYNRRPPTPRGTPALLSGVAADVRARLGGAAAPVITRDGVATSDVAYLPPPSSAGLAPAGQIAGGVAVVERSHDSLAPLTPDEPAPTGGTTALVVAGAVALAAIGAFVLFTRPAGGR